MLVVKLPIICARSALQNFGPSYFSCQEDTSASLWELPLLCSLSLAILKPYACARTYVRTLPNFTTAVQSGNETTQIDKSRMHNYVSTSAEKGPAKAGPAGLVLAPIDCTGHHPPISNLSLYVMPPTALYTMVSYDAIFRTKVL